MYNFAHKVKQNFIVFLKMMNSEAMSSLIVYYVPRPESLSSWCICYKCRGEAEAFISHIQKICFTDCQ